MFIFKRCPINSNDNIAIMFTWKFIYNSKFTNETLLCIPFTYALKFLFSVFSLMELPQSIIEKEVVKVIELELKI